MFWRQLPVAYRQKARQTGLGGQQVVIAVVAAIGGHLESDAQQLPLGMEEEAEIHPARLPGHVGQAGDTAQLHAGGPCCLLGRSAKAQQRGTKRTRVGASRRLLGYRLGRAANEDRRLLCRRRQASKRAAGIETIE